MMMTNNNVFLYILLFITIFFLAPAAMKLRKPTRKPYNGWRDRLSYYIPSLDLDRGFHGVRINSTGSHEGHFHERRFWEGKYRHDLDQHRAGMSHRDRAYGWLTKGVDRGVRSLGVLSVYGLVALLGGGGTAYMIGHKRTVDEMEHEKQVEFDRESMVFISLTTVAGMMNWQREQTSKPQTVVPTVDLVFQPPQLLFTWVTLPLIVLIILALMGLVILFYLVALRGDKNSNLITKRKGKISEKNKKERKERRKRMIDDESPSSSSSSDTTTTTTTTAVSHHRTI